MEKELTNSRLLQILRENDCTITLHCNEDYEDSRYYKWYLTIYKPSDGLISIYLYEEEYNDILEEEYS